MDERGITTGKLIRPRGAAQGVNWTSTTIPMWQMECEGYRKMGGAFQVKHVTTNQHRAFVEAFAARSNFDYRLVNEMAILTPKTLASAVVRKDPMTSRQSLSEIFCSKRHLDW